MSRVCQVTGKGPRTGNTVSHANNRKRRRFLPNLHTHRFWSEIEKRFLSLRVSTRGLRTIEKLARAGIDVGVNIAPMIPGLGDEDLERFCDGVVEALAPPLQQPL